MPTNHIATCKFHIVRCGREEAIAKSWPKEHELDKELEARGLHFVRYADDCVIAVKSEASAKRVMRTITNWIEKKLGLKVNMAKTHITKPDNLKYLGFGFYYNQQTKAKYTAQRFS